MRRQAERWGAELFQEDVEFLDVNNRPFTVQSGERKVIHYFIWIFRIFKLILKDFKILAVQYFVSIFALYLYFQIFRG